MTEMTGLARSRDKYVTLYVGPHNQSATFGDLSVKNSAQGLSGIHWIKVKQQEHGKLAHLREFALTYEDQENRKVVGSKLPLVLTLSSSSISIPEK